RGRAAVFLLLPPYSESRGTRRIPQERIVQRPGRLVLDRPGAEVRAHGGGLHRVPEARSAEDGCPDRAGTGPSAGPRAPSGALVRSRNGLPELGLGVRHAAGRDLLRLYLVPPATQVAEGSG